MEEFVIIANQTLTNEEEVIYSNSKGAVVKTILLCATTQAEVVLTFDSTPFNFIANNQTTIITTPIMVKEIKGLGDGVNIHITGLQL